VDDNPLFAAAKRSLQALDIDDQFGLIHNVHNGSM